MGDESSVQRPRSTSSGPRWKGLKRAASETRRQKFCRAVRAPSAPPLACPETSSAAFIAPADVPEMPSIPSHGSSSRSECSVRASALQRKIDEDGITCDGGLRWCHWQLPHGIHFHVESPILQVTRLHERSCFFAQLSTNCF